MNLIKLVFTMFITYSITSLATDESDTILEFTIVVPSFNNEVHVEKNLNSIIKQITSHKFEVIYIDDNSSDSTGLRVDEYVVKNNAQDLIKVIHNKKRVGALENIYNTVHSCPDHKHIILVDGDDELTHERVIERVAQEYLYHDAWITYGDFAWNPPLDVLKTPPLPSQEIIDGDLYYFRKNGGQSHLRTFKAQLFKKIKKEDLLYEGNFFQMAWDTAIILPGLEMASKGHISYIPEDLYLYYWWNPISDRYIDRDLQHALDKYIRAKTPYAPLSSLDDQAIYVLETSQN